MTPEPERSEEDSPEDRQGGRAFPQNTVYGNSMSKGPVGGIAQHLPGATSKPMRLGPSSQEEWEERR